MIEPYPTRTDQEREFLAELEEYAAGSRQTHVERLSNFPAWAPRQNIARFLAAADIYKRIIGVHGVIIEGGVAGGAGLFTWAHLASILEPYNYGRKIIGFDLAEDGTRWMELARLALLHDTNRPVSHIGCIEMVAGDAVATIPAYVDAHPGMMVAMLVVDFTKLEPTQIAINWLVPLIPSGGVIVAGGIWPEEMEVLDPAMRWERCPWSPTLCFAVKP